MSKYRVLVADSNEFLASFDYCYEAIECAEQYVESTVKETCVVEEIGVYKPVLDSYETATAYLGGDAKNHQKALLALEKLIVIAEAWNKQDGFVPDFSNRNQSKYFPGFVYNDKAAGFVYAHANSMRTYMWAYFSSWLCFKSEERAEQFGKQFIDLWNDFLLYR